MEADAPGGEPVINGDFPGKMFAANDGPETDKCPDRDLSAWAVLTVAGASPWAVCTMQHLIPGTLNRTGNPAAFIVRAAHPDIRRPEAAPARQQGILQGFGGMNAPRRLRLIATVRNILRNTFTILLIPKDFAAVKKIVSLNPRFWIKRGFRGVTHAVTVSSGPRSGALS